MSSGHLSCPKCQSAGIRLTVREWGVCENCQHGGMWSEFMTCDCWGYDCPDITN
ncbi:hypothetical protein GCM10010211_00860 [Streptomyces albospinus]|uniref:Uncharacterized protein n=1 Tax=Streptomyces albospinus TaxID=285515 RepID=A0ABQ2UKC4_9ACTN|nr:hypothetical protein [Streptomyces albospinus]GGU41677.1 hypothetical protein GCM10010211_00860 [Streptomyces albospinus]